MFETKSVVYAVVVNVQSKSLGGACFDSKRENNNVRRKGSLCLNLAGEWNTVQKAGGRMQILTLSVVY